jgi:hypothetical protein
MSLKFGDNKNNVGIIENPANLSAILFAFDNSKYFYFIEPEKRCLDKFTIDGVRIWKKKLPNIYVKDLSIYENSIFIFTGREIRIFGVKNASLQETVAIDNPNNRSFLDNSYFYSGNLIIPDYKDSAAAIYNISAKKILQNCDSLPFSINYCQFNKIRSKLLNLSDFDIIGESNKFICFSKTLFDKKSFHFDYYLFSKMDYVLKNIKSFPCQPFFTGRKTFNFYNDSSAVFMDNKIKDKITFHRIIFSG